MESLQKPPRNNTTALKNPPFKVYLRSPELAGKLEAVSDYVRWGTGLPPRLTELAIMVTARNGRTNGFGAATIARRCAGVSIPASAPTSPPASVRKK